MLPHSRSAKDLLPSRGFATPRTRQRTWHVVPLAPLLAALALLAPGLARATSPCAPALAGCRAAAHHLGRACLLACNHLTDPAERRACRAPCAAQRAAGKDDCRSIGDACLACGDVAPRTCRDDLGNCRRRTRSTDAACRERCRSRPAGSERDACRVRCAKARAGEEQRCAFRPVRDHAGPAALPELPAGRAADLSQLLDADEMAVVEAADARAPELRTTRLRIVGPPETEVRVTQVRHAFRFGFPIDSRRFEGRDEERDFFLDLARRHATLAVTEGNPKWAKVEVDPGSRVWEPTDRDVSLAEERGFLVKGHTLYWGIVPPFSSSGVPAWALARWPSATLDAAERDELRQTLRRFVLDVVGRYRGRIALWDVTNETLQPLAQWLVARLGAESVADVFRWAHEADPDATLVFNEWIVEVFTGLSAQPTAATVRDRVRELLDAGVPVHAIGQQAHFTPGAAFAGLPVDLGVRTRIDDYAIALDTLAEAGLPIHITEVNFIAPDAPELRAAQAEALMRLWWGHPAVEQVVLWGLWNTFAGRRQLDVGLWRDDRTLSRHGEAVVSLLNDRWRTRAVVRTDTRGVAELTVTLGDYAAEWTVAGEPRHAMFSAARAARDATVIALGHHAP